MKKYLPNQVEAAKLTAQTIRYRQSTILYLFASTKDSPDESPKTMSERWIEEWESKSIKEREALLGAEYYDD